MRTISQSITNSWDLAVSGKYFRLLAAGYPVNITFYRQGASIYDAHDVDAGFYTVPDGGFDRVRIDYAGTQTVKVGISNGQGGYDTSTSTVVGTVATTVSGTVDTLSKLGATIAEVAAVSVGTAATALLAADMARRSVRFYNNGAYDIWLGSSAVTTANGCIKIAPGQTHFEDDAPGAAWYGISGTAAQEVRIQKVV